MAVLFSRRETEKLVLGVGHVANSQMTMKKTDELPINTDWEKANLGGSLRFLRIDSVT